MDLKEKEEEEEGKNTENKPEFYLLITGEAGKNNYGVLVRSASAFDCKEIFILGAKKMKYIFFSSVDELNKYCLKNGIQICGVNINYKDNKIYNSLPIQDINFENKKTLFVLGNTMYPIEKDLESIINLNMILIYFLLIKKY